MNGLTQEDKFIRIDTPLGDDVLLVSFSGTESISKPYQFRLELLSANFNILPDDIVGKKVDITLLLSDNVTKRIINGYIFQFIAGAIQGNGYRAYYAELVPWLHLLQLHSDCRLFQNMDVKAVIEKVFNSHGYTDYEISTQGNFRTREYCVQYRESDFSFVSRLMEEEGIFYYFKHEEGKHTLVLADKATIHDTCTESEARYFTAGKSGDHLNKWENQYSLIPGKWSQTDYCFKTPSNDISTTINTMIELSTAADFERYDYPGLYQARGDGDGLTKVRIEEEEAAYNYIHASGTYRSFIAGGKFTLNLHEVGAEQDKSYIISSISHYARENSYDPGETGGREYSNDFQCIPDNIPCRPERVTHKPVVQGLQTAIVVGPSGEEIYTDEFGRIKVQFHWDRVGEKNENSSCWLRVGQQMAGKQWGAIFIPRIGHEVIVSFLEGDPDQPLVIGSVYNADNMPPYALPANKTQSGWKTRSTTGGGAANCNEIRFEDKKGGEELFIQAEKDQNNNVKNDESTTVGNNRSETIGNDETISIGNNRTEIVGTDETITIGSNRTETVGSNETITIGANRSETVGNNETITIAVNKAETIGIAKELSIGGGYQVCVGAAMNETIGGAKAEEIGAIKSVNVGVNSSENIGKDKSVSAGKKITYTCGDDYALKGGKKGVIDIADELTIKVGKATLLMKKDGTITISGKDINFNAKGEINIKAKKNVVIKGKKVLAN